MHRIIRVILLVSLGMTMGAVAFAQSTSPACRPQVLDRTTVPWEPEPPTPGTSRRLTQCCDTDGGDPITSGTLYLQTGFVPDNSTISSVECRRFYRQTIIAEDLGGPVGPTDGNWQYYISNLISWSNANRAEGWAVSVLGPESGTLNSRQLIEFACGNDGSVQAALVECPCGVTGNVCNLTGRELNVPVPTTVPIPGGVRHVPPPVAINQDVGGLPPLQQR